jgi:hypothetical protein
MKKVIKSILTQASVIGLLGLADADVQSQVAQTASFSGSELIQTASPKVNGKTTSLKPPTKTALTTATLLADLATDETAAGQWPWAANTVPPNAKLIATFSGGAVSHSTAFNSLSFKVVSGTTAVEVSNIFSGNITGVVTSNAVSSFTYNTEAGGIFQPPFSLTYYLPYTLTYDGTAVGGTLQFGVTGTATLATVVSTPNAKTGLYSEKDTFSLADGTGSGISRGFPFVLTGVTITASGSGTVAPE